MIRLVQLGGLEPPTSCSTDRRSNQLSYNCIPDRAEGVSRSVRAGKRPANGAETMSIAALWQGRKAGLTNLLGADLQEKARTRGPGLIVVD